MSWARQDILSIALLGEGAALVRVQRGVGALSSTRLGVIESVMRTDPKALQRLVGRAPGRVVVVMPPGATLVRQVAFGLKEFQQGAAELQRSAGELFPLAADDLALGFVRRVARESGDEMGGYLIAAQRSRIEPVLDHLRNALGIQAITMLSPTMAMLGYDLQGQEKAWVEEQGPMGSMYHGLRHGQVVELDGEPGAAPAQVTMPTHAIPESEHGYLLAEAAALALDTARSEIAPMGGAMPSRAKRWVTPAICAAAAVLLLIAAPALREARHARAIDRLNAQRAAMASELAHVQEARRDLEHYAAMIEQVRALDLGEPSHVLGDLVAAHQAVPLSAFVEQIDIQRASITLRGAAERAGDVLAGLEASTAFDSARDVSPPSPLGSSLDNKEAFEIAAERVQMRTQDTSKNASAMP